MIPDETVELATQLQEAMREQHLAARAKTEAVDAYLSAVHRVDVLKSKLEASLLPHDLIDEQLASLGVPRSDA